MNINIYEGKPNHEQFITCLGDTKDYPIPHKKELICIGNRNKLEDEVYKVINTLYDYAYSNETFPEIAIFVEKYNWED